MKLTEQQLQQMFQNSRRSDADARDIDLDGYVAASDSRLAAVERIADDATLSATQHVMNQLHDWSSAIESDIKLSIKPRFYDQVLNWIKPSFAVAAVVTAVVFMAPQMDQANSTQPVINVSSDRIMFTASFQENSDVINNMNFDGQLQPSQEKSDQISSINFG